MKKVINYSFAGTLVASILCGSLSAYATPSEWPVKGTENLMIENGVDLEKYYDEEGTLVLDYSKSGVTKDELDRLIEENNDKIQNVILEENALITLQKENNNFSTILKGWWNTGTELRIDVEVDVSATELQQFITSSNIALKTKETTTHKHDWVYYGFYTKDNKILKYKVCTDCCLWNSVKDTDFPQKI